jgi:hypothetical protein
MITVWNKDDGTPLVSLWRVGTQQHKIKESE